MKNKPGRAGAPITFDYEQYLEDLKHPATDLWLRHLAADPRMLADFSRYLNLQIGRAESHAMNLKGPEMSDDLLRLQGGARALATIRHFVTSFIANRSGEAGGTGEASGGEDARRSEQPGQNTRTNRG